MLNKVASSQRKLEELNEKSTVHCELNIGSRFMSILEKKVINIEEGTKIREYLKTELGLSTRLIRSASIDKRIFVNDEVVKINRILNVGEVIKIDFQYRITITQYLIPSCVSKGTARS